MVQDQAKLMWYWIQCRTLTKFTYMSKIHSNRSINCLLIEQKKVEIKKWKTPKGFIDYSQRNDNVYKNLKTIIQQTKGEC